MTDDWQREVADGLTPQEAAAARVTGSIRTSDLPTIATWWLVAGHDTTALRELAGTGPNDVWSLDALLGRFMQDIAIATPDEHEATRTDVRRILTRWSIGHESTIEVLRELDLMILYRFDGLDVAGGLLDEIEGGWGRPASDVLVDAEERLRTLLDELGPRPTWPTEVTA